jgi:hypothetical protein
MQGLAMVWLLKGGDQHGVEEIKLLGAKQLYAIHKLALILLFLTNAGVILEIRIPQKNYRTIEEKL